MQYQSVVSRIGEAAQFPAFMAERVYMRPFFQRDGLPSDLSRWNELVASMLGGIETDKPIYLMIDQKHVKAGDFHRRPGVHIDGYWGGTKWSHISAHGGDGGMPSHHTPSPGHSYVPPARDHHRPGPSHSYTPPVDVHSPVPRRHSAGLGNWATSPFAEKEAIILASNVSACDAYEGEFSGPIGDMGDCASIPLDGLRSIRMEENTVYAGNVTMLHETLACPVDCDRTVVRLNVPGWSPLPAPKDPRP